MNTIRMPFWSPLCPVACASLVVALSGCSDLLAPEDLPEQLRAPQLSVSTWEHVVRDGFSFRLPPGFSKTDGIPIDSDAASYVRDNDVLHYDYGAYSAPWQRSQMEPVSDLIEVRVMLGGRPAQLVSYRLDGRYMVRAYWGGVGSSTLGQLDLVVRGESSTVGGRRDLLAVIHSVRFD